MPQLNSSNSQEFQDIEISPREIGSLIRETRLKLGLKANEMALQLNYDAAMISKVEKGKSISANFIDRFLQEYKVTEDTKIKLLRYKDVLEKENLWKERSEKIQTNNEFNEKADAGAQPFEFIASLMEAQKMAPAPSLFNRTKIRINESAYFDSSSIAYQVRKIEQNKLDEFNQMNRDLFEHTTFALPLHEIKKRNNPLFEANELMFAIVDGNIDGQYLPIGISHIILLNDFGKTLYVKDNGLKDSEIRPEHIAKPSEWCNAIVMFSMGILPAFRNVIKDREFTLPYVFGEHLASIISEMRKLNPDKTCTYIYAQTEKPKGGIGRMFLDVEFENLGITTGDKCPLWGKKIEFSSHVLDRDVLTNLLLKRRR